MLQVDPDIAELVGTIPIGTVGADSLALTRSAPLAPPVALSDAVERRDHLLPGGDGVRVRVHRPVGVEGELPCFYSIHGGGYVVGSYEMG
jgi:acetyl esterase